MIVSIESKLFSEKGYPRSMALRSKFGTSLEASLFGPFGLKRMTRCSTTSNGMKRGSSITFGTRSFYMPRWLGNVCSKTLRLVLSRLWLYSKVSTTRGELGTCFVKGTTFTLSGIGRRVTFLDRLVVRVGRVLW